MTLFDTLRPECIQLGSKSTTKDEVLKELASLAKQCPALSEFSSEDLYTLLKEREDLGSTGFGGGIAIPHASIDSLEEFVVGVLVAPKGVPFATLDGEPAYILVLIFGPSNRRNDHVRLLSTLSTILNREKVVQELCGAGSAEVVRETMLRHEAPESAESEGKRSMVLAFTQDEECFERVLQIFSASENGSVSVLDASNARTFLNRMPVFSAFWTESPAGFQRVVVGIVASEFSNDVVRQIHTAADANGRESGLLVAVLELAYCAGTLDF